MPNAVCQGSIHHPAPRIQWEHGTPAPAVWDSLGQNLFFPVVSKSHQCQ